MKRIAFVLFGLLIVFGLAATALSAQYGDQNPASVPHPPACPPLINCPFTPSPQPGGNFNPGDPDGDGIPNGIDLCPDQGGPSSNSGCPPGVSPDVQPATGSEAAPPPQPSVNLPTMPSTGDCVLATRGTEGVNIRAEPSTNAEIVGVLDPQMLYPVIAQLDNSEGMWDRIAEGWVARSVVRQGGDCDLLPQIDEPGAADTDLVPLTLIRPDGFTLTLDKGTTPGEDTPQGYCSTGFGIDMPDNGGTDTIHFDFGDSTRCITLNPDGQGFVFFPPDPCNPADGSAACHDVGMNWYVGFDPATGTPVFLNWLSTFLNGSFHRRDGTVATSQPGEPGMLPSVLLVWRFYPPDPCRAGGGSCANPGATHGFALNFGLQAPPDPDKTGVTFTWRFYPPDPCRTGGGSCANPGTANSFAIDFGLFPPDPCRTGGGSCANPGAANSFAIDFGLFPPDPCRAGGASCVNPGTANSFAIDFGLQAPPDPDFQGFGIAGMPDVLCAFRRAV